MSPLIPCSVITVMSPIGFIDSVRRILSGSSQIDRDLAAQLTILQRALIGAGGGEALDLVQVLLAAERGTRLREQLFDFLSPAARATKLPSVISSDSR